MLTTAASFRLSIHVILALAPRIIINRRRIICCYISFLQSKHLITTATAIAATTVITIATRIIHHHTDFYPEHGITAENTSSIQNHRRIIGFLSSLRGVAFVVAKIVLALQMKD
jgi:hypothetical protein